MLFTVSNLHIDDTFYILDILSNKYNFKHINLKDFTETLKQMIKEYKLSEYFDINYNDKIKQVEITWLNKDYEIVNNLLKLLK